MSPGTAGSSPEMAQEGKERGEGGNSSAVALAALLGVNAKTSSVLPSFL
jgi:hypothetical protein